MTFGAEGYPPIAPDSIIEQITEQNKTYKTVLPACKSVVCSAGVNNGWILKDPSGPAISTRKKRKRNVLSAQELKLHTTNVM